MTVSTEDVLAARERALRHDLSPTERRRWERVVEYAETRPADPAAKRIDDLRAVIGPDVGADAFSSAGDVLAADVLAAGVTGAADLRVAGAVRELCLAWFAEDVASAAPLLELFTGHHRDLEGGPPKPDPSLVQRLRTWLAAGIGSAGDAAEVTVIAGGFSRLMLDVRWTGGRGVVRVEQDGMFATEGAREVAVMGVLSEHGYPVPRVLWSEPDASVLGHPFFVIEHVEGAARTDDGALDHMLRSVADLHALPSSAVDAIAGLDGVAPAASPQTVVEAQLAHWHAVYRSAVAEPIPLLEQGFAWLRANLPMTGPVVVTHGDPGPGNVLQGPAGVTAVLDWELSHAGDAAEDWAYLVLIRGRKLASAHEWKARLRSSVGIEYDESTWRAWEAYNSVMGACVNLTALDVFRRSERPTPDMLAIGVAVHLRFLARVVELTCPPPLRSNA